MEPVHMQGWKRGRSEEPSQRHTRQMSGGFVEDQKFVVGNLIHDISKKSSEGQTYVSLHCTSRFSQMDVSYNYISATSCLDVVD